MSASEIRESRSRMSLRSCGLQKPRDLGKTTLRDAIRRVHGRTGVRRDARVDNALELRQARAAIGPGLEGAADRVHVGGLAPGDRVANGREADAETGADERPQIGRASCRERG